MVGGWFVQVEQDCVSRMIPPPYMGLVVLVSRLKILPMTAGMLQLRKEGPGVLTAVAGWERYGAKNL